MDTHNHHVVMDLSCKKILRKEHHMVVYVIDKNGQPLDPTKRCGKVRRLLKEGKAKVVHRCPFTIKLLYESTTYTHPHTLGVDTGSVHVGTAVCNRKSEIVYLSDVTIRGDIKQKMDRRRKYRRARRNRKTRYRKPRFLNRGNSTKTDRFSPTMRSKLASHEKEERFVRSILPIGKVIYETGQFDPHLMKNPDLKDYETRSWGYQHGPNYGFANTKAMVLDRDGYTCQCCKGKRKDSRLEVHHIVYRSHGGSDDQSNLVTLCHTCHKGVHDGSISLKLKGLAKGTLNHATQMNSIRVQLMRRHPDAIQTFGYITKENRQQLGICKTHAMDACVIATGGKPFSACCMQYNKVCVPRGDMQRTKGVRSQVRIPDGKIAGFLKFDKVKYFGKEYFVKGRYSTGYAILMDLAGNKIDFSGKPNMPKIPKLSNMTRLEARSSWMIMQEAVAQSIA